MIALPGYDHTLYGDNNTNKLEEAKQLFAYTLNKHLPSIPVLVILNKYDLFVEKLKDKPFEYDGNPLDDPKEALYCIKAQFMELIENDRSRVKFCVMDCIDGGVYYEEPHQSVLKTELWIMKFCNQFCDKHIPEEICAVIRDYYIAYMMNPMIEQFL